MKSSEKKLVGIAMVMGGIGLVFGLGLPQWDTFNANMAKAEELKTEMTAAQTQKESLNLQIALLEKNIDIPSYIQVKTFTDDTEEESTKELLDHVVNLATSSGNKFVSMNPTEVEPFMAAKPVVTDPAAAGAASPAPASPAGAVDAAKAAVAPPADGQAPSPEAAAAAAAAAQSLLLTKGYELTVRGTYDSLQSFLRAMDGQKMILDMLNFQLLNEAGDATGADKVLDANYPLRLKVTLRLALQRLESKGESIK